MKTILVHNATSTYQHDCVSTGPVLEHIVIALVGDNRLTGAYTLNHFRFSNFGLSYLAMNMNGKQIPRLAYEPYFRTNDYIREYLALFEGLAMDIGNQAINLRPEQWGSDYPHFIFRLAPWGHPSLPKSGNLRIELKYRTALPATINLICFAEYASLLEIERAHSVVKFSMKTLYHR